MKYDPQKHHRRSIRLKGYDYSQAGAYFITICIQHGQMLLTTSAVQTMITHWWHELENKYPNIDLDAFVIMPNHIHFIIVITDPHVGATLRGRPSSTREAQPHRVAPTVAPTVGDIVGWFKTMTTNAYIRGVKQDNWPPFPKRLWQRNYYERIIRDERALNTIRQYIHDNPAKWREDKLHPDAPRNKFNASWG